MFIRRIKKPNKSVSICIVENSRDKDGSVKQALIKTVGTGKSEYELQILERAGREMMLVLRPNRDENKIKDPCDISDEIKLNTIGEIRRVNDGYFDIFGDFYDKCGLNDLISNTYKDLQWNGILKSLVIARIVSPSSKRKTAAFLSREYLTNIPLEKIYRTMDKIHDFESIIKNAILSKTIEISNNKITVMLFDVTTLYFESIESDELRNRGFSKDCKFKKVQIVLSLTTNEKGLPIDYCLFPGNTSEGKTLIEYINKIKDQYEAKDATLIADRAMFSENNLSELENKGIKYIVACKLKSLTKSIKEKILTDQDYRANLVEDDLCWAKDYDYKGRRVVVSYSSTRARKDRRHREMLVERIIKKSKNGKVKVSELINNNGSKKFINIISGQVEIDQEKITKDAEWDGLHGIITNDIKATSFSLLAQYRQLWRIEEAFRLNKHDLKMRPIYHWKPNRVRAHILICYIAFALCKFAQEKLREQNLNISIDKLREELALVESSILGHKPPSTEKDLYLLPAPLNEGQWAIYNAFGVTRRELPWRLLS